MNFQDHITITSKVESCCTTLRVPSKISNIHYLLMFPANFKVYAGCHELPSNSWNSACKYSGWITQVFLFKILLNQDLAGRAQFER